MSDPILIRPSRQWRRTGWWISLGFTAAVWLLLAWSIAR